MLTTTLIRSVAASAVLAAMLPAHPLRAQPAPEATTSIRQTLETRYPGVHVLDVKPSAMPGMYEVYLGNDIVYTDAHADYLLGGPLVDTQTRQNLTEARLNDFGRVDFNKLPLARSIRIVKGDGSRHFAVFSDPDCPYCQQLEKTLESVSDFTMYVLLFPIASLHPQATAKAHAIWCAPDRTQAWSRWMHEKQMPAAGSCRDDPVNELQRLGDRLHINSTPTLFFADGKRITGSLPAKELEELLNAHGRAPHG
jgi:thiol:disulfide interchange protein DsbC